MAGTLGDDNEQGIITDINVTPLVDVVLVLLIILMVTATAIVSRAIPMKLPKAATGEAASTQVLTVSIDEQGRLFLNQRPTTLRQLRAQVRRLRTQNPELRAVIAADGRVAHGRVVEVMDALRRERVTRFAIQVQPEVLQGR